jgi:hypothetical protein
MAQFDSPFFPVPEGVNLNPTPEQKVDLASQWKGWIENPENRTALMQFGLSMMQPIGLGQTSLGHFGQAVGEGGEAVDRRRKMELLEEEAGSRQDLRSAQAQSAESRAGVAAERARLAETSADVARGRLGVAKERLELDRERETGRMKRGGLSNAVRLQGQYRQYLSDVEKRNTQADLLGGQKTTPLSYQEWIKQNPSLSPPQPEEEVDPDEVAPAVEAPPAPRNPAERKANTVYQTPKGPLKWTGKGWVAP